MLDGFGAFLFDVVVQAAFKIHRAVGFRPLKVIAVVIHILLDESVDELGFIAHFSVLNHRVDDLAATFRIVLVRRVEVGNELEYVGNIDNVAVQQFQAEINVLDGLLFAVWFFRLSCHRCIWIHIAKSHIEILAAIVYELLFGHCKFLVVLVKFVVHLQFGVLLQDFTERENEVSLVMFALQEVNALHGWVLLLELFNQVIVFLSDVLKRLTNDGAQFFGICSAAEQLD